MSSSALAAGIRHLRGKLALPRHDRESDEQLLRAFLGRRDETAFAALVRRHGSMVLSVCRRVLGHQQDAEDAFQATFLVLARSAASLRNKEALTSWLYGTAYRIALKAKRAAARGREHEAQAPPRSPSDPADELSWREVRALLDEEIARLPDIYRSVFVLCCLEDLSRAEAARRLGLKERTVLSRLAEARKRLRRRLAWRGVDLTAVLAATALTMEPASAQAAALLDRMSRAAVSPAAAALAESAPPMVMTGKAKLAAALVLTAGVLAGAGAWAYRSRTAVAVAAPGHQPAAPAADGRVEDAVEVRGLVQDPDGKPLAGAKVYLSYYRKDRSKPKERATSGADGRFRFAFRKSEVNPHYAWFTDEGWRHASIVAVAAGYGPQWVEVASLDKGELTLRLVKDDVPIQGRVLDLEGRPVAAATIKVAAILAPNNEDLTGFLQTHRLDQSRSLLPWTVGLKETMTTGKDGRFRLTGIGRERIVRLDIGGPTLETAGVLALARRGVDEKALNAPRPEQATLRLDEPRPRKIYGARFDHLAGPTKPFVGTVRAKGTGKPLPGIRIRMVEPDGKGYYPIETVTDEKGRYRLIGCTKASTYRLAAASDGEGGYIAVYRSVGDTPGREPTTVDFELTPGVLVQGHLRDKETGKPIRGHVHYEALPENKYRTELPDRSYYVTARVSGDGAFRLVALPGPGLIRAINDDGRFLRARLDPAEKAKGRALFDAHAYRIIAPAKAGESLTCDLELVPGKTRRVFIVAADGKPLTGVSVHGLRDRAVETQTLDKAVCTAIGLDAERPRRLTFLHAEKKLAGHVLLRGDEPEPVKVELVSWGALTGRVVDADGRPIVGAKVDLYHHTRTMGIVVEAHRPNREATLTDRDGRFRVEGLVPGLKYIVFIHKKGLPALRVIERDGVTVETGQTKDLGEARTKLPTDE